MCTTYPVSVVDPFDNPRVHEVAQSLFQLIRGQAAHFLEFSDGQVNVEEGEDDLQIPLVTEAVPPHAHNLGEPRFDLPLQFIEVIQKFIAHPDHSLEHREISRKSCLLVLLNGGKRNPILLLQVYDEIDVMREVVILSSAVVLAGDEEFCTFHQLQVLNHRFRTEHQALGDLSHKTRLLPQQFYYSPPVPVSQDIEETGNLIALKHIY